jgi:PadR family transcriptional regulator, regulatory protein PadR
LRIPAAACYFYYKHECSKNHPIEGTHVKGERLGEFEELVLLAVRRLGKEAHSARIREVLAESAGREVTLGAIYTALDRAARKGYAESWVGEPTAERGGRAKRHFALTEAGLGALRENRLVREQLWALPGGARP